MEGNWVGIVINGVNRQNILHECTYDVNEQRRDRTGEHFVVQTGRLNCVRNFDVMVCYTFVRNDNRLGTVISEHLFKCL